VRGDAINGKVCAFGADFQIIRPNELIELEAKYAFETTTARVYVENKGIRFGRSNCCSGSSVASRSIQADLFPHGPKFETGAEK